MLACNKNDGFVMNAIVIIFTYSNYMIVPNIQRPLTSASEIVIIIAAVATCNQNISQPFSEYILRVNVKKKTSEKLNRGPVHRAYGSRPIQITQIG